MKPEELRLRGGVGFGGVGTGQRVPPNQLWGLRERCKLYSSEAWPPRVLMPFKNYCTTSIPIIFYRKKFNRYSKHDKKQNE